MDIQQIEKTIKKIKKSRAKLELVQRQLANVRNFVQTANKDVLNLKEQFAALKADYDACESQHKALLDALEKK